VLASARADDAPTAAPDNTEESMTAQSGSLLLPTLFFTALCSPAPKIMRVANLIFVFT